MTASLADDGARGARARRRSRRLLRPLRIVARRPGLALPRAARLARPERADHTGRARREGRSAAGSSRFSWRASSDDVGPVAYRLYENGRFVREVTRSSVAAGPARGRHGQLLRSRRGRRRPPEPAATSGSRLGSGSSTSRAGCCATRFGRRRSARSPSAGRRKTVVLSWPAVRDPGGLARLPDQGRRSDALRDEALGDARASDAAHRRLGRRGRQGRQRRPDDDRPAPPPPLTYFGRKQNQDLREQIRSRQDP